MMSTPLLILIILAGYFLIWQAISYFSSKGADNATFFSGNRKMPWPLVAIAMIGAPITGVTLVSVPGMVVTKGFSYLQMCIGFVIGYLIIAFVLVPLYYKLNIVSVYEYLQKRFGKTSYRTGAWLFFVSKIFGISIRFLMVCTMLQLLLFEPLRIPYYYCVIVSLLLIWVSTIKGGVRSVIWSDTLKSVFLISTIVLCLFFISQNLGLSWNNLLDSIGSHSTSKIFFFDDPSDGKYFLKQVIAGIFIVVAMTGLDQDMMQRTLACKNPADAKKNLFVSSIMQVVVISLLLCLGTLMVIYVESKGIAMPEKTDNLFATVAFHNEIPLIVGVLLVLGIISATYASVGSALTALTTTMCVDIMDSENIKERQLSRRRKYTHTIISLVIAALVVAFYYMNQQDAISTVYALISYTDGPILGLFLFGILTKRQVDERLLPYVCLASPVLSWLIQWGFRYYLQYEISFELLVINSSLTFLGLWCLSYSWRDKKVEMPQVK